MADSFIHRRADYKLWAENTKGRYEDQRNGATPRCRYDPNNNEEDNMRIQEAIRELVNEVTFGRK